MKVIFLDFDGVMNTSYHCNQMMLSQELTEDEFGIYFDPEAVNNLQRIIDQTGAKIVISSSWNYIYTYKDYLKIWERRELPGFVIDVTPTVSKRRGDNIDQWLRECGHVSDYVIIDDLVFSNFNANQLSHLVCVDGYFGLDEAAADKAIDILNNTTEDYVELGSKINDAALLIIPDVHGRTFWKAAVSQYPEIPVIFLGDYLDPYHNEIVSINKSEAWLNFHEIMKYKKRNYDRVTLLLGNHDVHYFSNDIYGFRKDLENEEYIRTYFAKQLDCFKLTTSVEIGGRNFLFSHAGIKKEWLRKYFNTSTLQKLSSMCEEINNRVSSVDSLETFLNEGLFDISYYRYGNSAVGSIVWADVEEFISEDEEFNEVMQIFGHTQQLKNPIITTTFACLDCRCAFVLTKDGEILKI